MGKVVFPPGDFILERTNVDIDSISAHDLQMLKFLLDECQNLAKCNLVKSGAKLKVEIEVDASYRILKTDETLPPKDDLNSLYHILRPVILQKEKTYLPKIINILRKHTQNIYFREILNNLQKAFLLKTTIEYIRVRNDQGELISNESNYQNWLNSNEYHRQEDKKQKLEEKDVVHKLNIQNYQYNAMTYQKAISVLKVAGIIDWLLNEKTETYTFARKDKRK